jgi:hypothetical protein
LTVSTNRTQTEIARHWFRGDGHSTVSPPRRRVFGCLELPVATVSRSVVEWDAEADLDLPAGDTDLLDDLTHEPLAPVEVEPLQACPGSGGKVA